MSDGNVPVWQFRPLAMLLLLITGNYIIVVPSTGVTTILMLVKKF
jgi:hypothetical protein